MYTYLQHILNIYLRLVSQAVQSRQFGQFGEASVIDAEVQMFVQDAEVLIAAFYNPTTTLQEDDSEQSDNKWCQGLKTAATVHHFRWSSQWLQPQTQQLFHGCKSQNIRATDGERKREIKKSPWSITALLFRNSFKMLRLFMSVKYSELVFSIPLYNMCIC